MVAGSTTSFGSGSYYFSLPVAAAARYTAGQPLGQLTLKDADVGSFPGQVVWTTSTTIQPWIGHVYGTSISATGVTNTVPFTFASTDYIKITGCYEAA